MLSANTQSGIDLLDERWGGLSRGSAYLLYGEEGAGRDRLALHLACSVAGPSGSCVLASYRPLPDLALRASSIGFDLEEAREVGRLHLVRISEDLATGEDGSIARALFDLARFAHEARPDCLVIDDFTPFIRFGSLERLRQAVPRFLDVLRDAEITTVLTLDEPDTAQARALVAFLREEVTGTVHLSFDPHSTSPTARRLSLLPGRVPLPFEPMLEWDLSHLHSPDAALALDAGSPATESAGDGATGSPASPSMTSGYGGARSGSREPLPATIRDVVATQAWKGALRIRFVEHDEADDPATGQDAPTRLDLPSSVIEQGHYLEGETDPLPSDASPSPERPGTPRPMRPAPAPPRVATSPSDVGSPVEFVRFDDVLRSGAGHEDHGELDTIDQLTAFTMAFDDAIAEHRAKGTPFVALALRMDLRVPAAVHYCAIVERLRQAVGPDDMLLADQRRGWLAMVLPGRTTSAARSMLRGLRDDLRGSAAEAALRATSVIVAENGERFSSPSDFLACVMSGA